MIKIENINVVGWKAAIRGARNSMNSWEKSDTLFFHNGTSYGYLTNILDELVFAENEFGLYVYARPIHVSKEKDETFKHWSFIMDVDTTQLDFDAFGSGNFFEGGMMIGPNDLKLLTNLAKAGSDEAKFRRMIAVYVDITAPMYWWKEADTYKVGTVRNSCSTMHKIHAKEFTLEDFSCEHLIFDKDVPDEEFDCVSNDFDAWNTLNDKYCGYIDSDFVDFNSFPGESLKHTIAFLNRARELYLKTKDKKYWWQMIQLLPSSYNQRATLMLNYEVLANMYHARKNHKLDEWREFCEWIETLPYAKKLIIGFQMRTDIYKPTVLSKDRILVNVCEEKDGVIELRREVPDLYLGVGVNFAQSRILVDSDSYIKGMAVYSGDIPGDFDMVVNVRDEQRAFNELDYKCAFSKYSCQKLKQRFYEDPETGDIKLSPINVIDNDDYWKEWEKEFSNKISMILAKPPIIGQLKR